MADKYYLYEVQIAWREPPAMAGVEVIHRGARNFPEMQQLATEEAQKLNNPKSEAGKTAGYNKSNTCRAYWVARISEIQIPGFKINLEKLVETAGATKTQ